MSALSLSAVTYRAPSAPDHGALRAMARRSFSDAFAHRYDEEPFAAFLDEAYGDGGAMDRDLGDPAVQWHTAFQGAQPVGYAKLTPLRAPAAGAAPGALELQQIYVLTEWHGTGVAGHLMDWALATATTAGSPELYLTVFDHNERAKRFYRRHGFTEVARCTFTLGDRVDDDRIWRRVLRDSTSP